jgi:hypothetical protein
MTKPKRRGGITSPVIPQEHHVLHDAPDNILNIPRGPSPGSGTDSGRNPPESQMTRQSSRLWPTNSTIPDIEGRHLSTLNNYNVIERRSDCKSDHNWRSTQNDSSRHWSSTLTPIEAVEDRGPSPHQLMRKKLSIQMINEVNNFVNLKRMPVLHTSILSELDPSLRMSIHAHPDITIKPVRNWTWAGAILTWDRVIPNTQECLTGT